MVKNHFGFYIQEYLGLCIISYAWFVGLFLYQWKSPMMTWFLKIFIIVLIIQRSSICKAVTWRLKWTPNTLPSELPLESLGKMILRQTNSTLPVIFLVSLFIVYWITDMTLPLTSTFMSFLHSTLFLIPMFQLWLLFHHGFPNIFLFHSKAFGKCCIFSLSYSLLFSYFTAAPSFLWITSMFIQNLWLSGDTPLFQNCTGKRTFASRYFHLTDLIWYYFVFSIQLKQSQCL